MSIDDVIKQLTTETEGWKEEKGRIVFRRPHPVVAKLEPDSAIKLLNRMAQPLTGDKERDTYILYHLMYVLLADGNSKNEFSPKRFVEIIEQLPKSIEFEKKPDRRGEPQELWDRYRSLIYKCRVTTGFPPFQKSVGPPESFEFMDAAKRKEAEGWWAEAKALEGKFKVIADPEAANYNIRMSWLQWMVRQVRGESIYGMLMCGDPKSFEAVIDQIGQHAKKDEALTVELLSFVNAAYFDGWLGQHGEPKLAAAAKELKRVVVAADAAAPASKDATKNRRKSLSELAFTLITAMEKGYVTTRGKEPQLVRPTVTRPPLAVRNVSPQAINIDVINDAIERGVTALEKLRPPDTDLGTLSYAAVGQQDWWKPEYSLPGQQALALWALHAAGESQNQLWVQKRAAWLACAESITTYDRALRLTALSRFPISRWKPWIKRDMDWLTESITDQGNFAATWPGGPSTGFGDNANGQYGILGVWGAAQTGYEVNDAFLKKIDQYWRQAQFPPTKDAAGWATRSYKSLKPGDNMNAFENRVAGPMTAGGVLSLSITERYLKDPKLLNVGNKPTQEMARGLRWLDENFNLDAIDGDSDLYYYLWTIQNVGGASGYRTFNNVDWFREATTRLLNQQRPDGLWTGPKGHIVSTSFALMYLSRARGPLAICKVRFDPSVPNWNNRPHDMVNLVDWLSKQFEVPTSWQIADLTQPTYELIESTTLYLASDKPVTLPEEKVARLREYVQAGGMLICAPEGSNTAAVTASLKKLATQLFPGREGKKADPKHPFYTLYQKVNPGTMPLWVVDSSVRPLMVVVEKDISRDLQADLDRGRDAFNLLANVYLYTAGQNAKRPRVQSNFVSASTTRPTQTVRVARIKYDGDFDPEPLAMPQLKAFVGNTQKVNLEPSVATPEELKDHQIAFLTCSGGASPNEEQLKALRAWIDAGGTLWIDNARGTANHSQVVQDVVRKLGLESSSTLVADRELVPTSQPTTRPGDEPLSYRTYRESGRPKITTIFLDGRPAVYWTGGDIASALAGVEHWEIAGPTVGSARRLVTHSILTASAKAPATQKAQTTQPAK